ncbi:MAG: RNase H family protein [Brevinema sp.]
MTIGYQELLTESNRFITLLHTLEVSAERIEDSFRDYQVKILIDHWTMVLYYKPSKQTFSIGTQEIKDPLQKSYIEKLWYQFQYPDLQEISGLCAYVDGSFYQNQIGWGLVLVENHQVIDTFGGKLHCSIEESSSYQIAGEIQSVLEALSYAFQHGYTKITIFYDYMGLQKWADGEWKTKSKIAQKYMTQLQTYAIKITWHKIAAHTGNRFNEMADKIAKGSIV